MSKQWERASEDGEVLAIVAALVGFETTVSRYQKDVRADREETIFDECLAWVQAFAAAVATRLHQRIFVREGKPSLLLWYGAHLPQVLLCGHVDVVEAGTGWSSKAFQATVRDRRLVGRGVMDMKGAVAALLDVLVREPLEGLGLLLTCDEEVGSECGTRFVFDTLRQESDWMPKVVFLPDGGAGYRLVAEQKGLIRINLQAQGKAAHGARPWLGRSALEQVMRGYHALQEAYPQPTSEEDWRVSVTLTTLHSGTNPFNSVPDRATGTLDVRFPSNVATREQLVAQIDEVLRPFGVTASADPHLFVEPFRLDLSSPWVELLQQAAEHELGERLPICREAGASDARWFAPVGVPVLMVQPKGGNWHGANEWVDMESLQQFRDLVATFVRTVRAEFA